MFHNRSVTFGGDSAPQSVNMRSSTHHQNENFIHRGNQMKSLSANRSNIFSSDTTIGPKKPTKNSSKTPFGKSTSNRRRAFGDISNKKSSSGFRKDSSSAKRNLQQNDVLKSRPNNHLPRAFSNAPTTENTRFAILPEKPKPSRLQGGLNDAVKNSQQSQLHRQNSLSKSTTQVKSHHAVKLDPVPDIERSAGRTWKQQLEYDLKSEDDMASISSADSIFNLKSYLTGQERLREERDFLWRQQKEMDDEEDRQVQEQIQAIMNREQKETEEGLDSLYDAIDNLDFFTDSSHGTKSHDLEGEESTAFDVTGFELDLPDDLSLSL